MKSQRKYADIAKFKTRWNFWKNLGNYFREFTEYCGIHGVRYLGEKRTVVERIFWVFILLLSLVGCFSMIFQIIDRYRHDPVVVSFATKDTFLFEIPFPAVTICPQSKCSEDKFNYSQIYHTLHSLNKISNYTQLRNFYYISLLCTIDQQNKLLKYYKNITVERDFFDVIDELKPAEITNCSYMGTDCLKDLTPVFTSKGICYSFNILDRKDMFREQVLHYNNFQNISSLALTYSSDFGYYQNIEIDTYPRRALLSGADNTLLIKFKHTTYDTDLFCNNCQKGFHILLHNPLEIPRFSKSCFHVDLDKTVVAAIEPKLIKTSDAVKSFSSKERNCYLEHERPLFYFKVYTQSNCIFECETNRTLKKCGCVHYYMPKTNKTRMCGFADYVCAHNASRELKISDLKGQISELENNFECDCKPSCTVLNYNVKASVGENYLKEYYNMVNINGSKKINNTHYSILSVYFKVDQFIATERSELYGSSDFVSNFGGLLGLCTGFTVVSFVEILYFVTIRIFYNIKLYGKWFGLAS